MGKGMGILLSHSAIAFIFEEYIQVIEHHPNYSLNAMLEASHARRYPGKWLLLLQLPSPCCVAAVTLAIVCLFACR
jgi:hypothetical protein